VGTGSGARAWKISPILIYLREEFPAPRFYVETQPVAEQLADRFSIVVGNEEMHTLLVRRSWFDAYPADWRIAEALRTQTVAERLRASGKTSVELVGE
jgi:hypothetical protein